MSDFDNWKAVAEAHIPAAIAEMDAIKPGFVALVLQAAHEAEQRTAAMRPCPV